MQHNHSTSIAKDIAEMIATMVLAVLAALALVGVRARRSRKTPKLIAFRAYERGYSTASDLYAPTTADGRELTDLLNEVMATLSIQNAKQNALVGLLTTPTTLAAEPVQQAATSGGFELATEFGVPVSLRSPSLALCGFEFNDYDMRQGRTRKFLENASASEIERQQADALAADVRNVMFQTVKKLYNNANSVNGEGNTVYSAYNGDGMVAPSFEGNIFDGTASHFITSGAATVDSGDAEQLLQLVTSKGTGVNGEELLLLVNPAEGKAVRSWRAGQANTNGAVASFDFVPTAAGPAYFTSQRIEGQQAPDDLNGVKIVGSYGRLLVVEDAIFPAGWISVVGTGGTASRYNPIGFRQSPRVGLQGLRLIPGNVEAYPLIDSFLTRSFGTGVRRRGGFATCRIAASGGYAVPAQYL